MNWHRLFGLILSDFFTGTPFEVEVEKDLSAKKQLLDVVIIRRKRGKLRRRPPDGLDDLAAHNLVTFKSHHEALDDWTLKELTGHYVNYRKQASPSMQALLPEEQFKLFAVCSRFPHALANHTELTELKQGVYACRRGSDTIRIIVAGQLAREEHNAPLHLFSARLDEIQYGQGHYRWFSDDTSTLLQNLFTAYRQEGVPVVYTIQDFRREVMQEELSKLSAKELKALLEKLPLKRKREWLEGIPPEQRLEGIPPEQRLAGIPPEQRLEGIPPEQRLEGIPPEQWLQGIPPEQRLQGIPIEEIEQYLKRRKRTANGRGRKKGR